MNPEDVKVLVSARMGAAAEALSDAKFLLNSRRGFRTIVNRAFYASYYATLALLQTCGKAPRTHGGLLRLIDVEFVKSGRIDSKMARLARRLFEQRQEDDYRKLEAITQAEAVSAVNDATQYVGCIEDYLRAEGYL